MSKFSELDVFSERQVAASLGFQLAKRGIYRLAGVTGQEWLDEKVRTSITFQKPGETDVITIAEAVVKVTQKRIITKTAVNGLKGTIKEYICEDDFALEITCAVSAMTGQDGYPEAAMRELMDLCRKPVSLEVHSNFLSNVFGINKMVVMEYTMDQQTYSNRQMITIKGVSDMDYEIRSEEV